MTETGNSDNTIRLHDTEFGRHSSLLRFAAGVLLAAAIALGIFYLVMQPRQRDLAYMGIFLTITSAITVTAGYAALRSGWISQAPSLRWALLATYIISSLLTFINVWITARLMFVSEHDLLLATILLLFASGIAVALGAFFAEALFRRIEDLRRAVRGLGDHGLASRTRVEGRDEIADLARTFNEMTAQLERMENERMELEHSRRQLIAWVSHDLQTPLTSIRAIVEALADGMIEDASTTERYLETAKREVESLSSLIDDLFELARIDAQGIELSRSQVALSDLISDTLENFSAVAVERGIKLDGSVEPALDPVWIDAERVGRILNNLVSNALHHTQAEGHVQITAWRDEEHVTVEVHDSGPGVDEEDLETLFEPFVRDEVSRSRKTGGAGLGLSIARGFVQAHGGTIEASNKKDGGAVFRFTLPG
jgi:signal transduction histidine kinase